MPDVQSTERPSDLLNKASAGISKRLVKLGDIKTSLGGTRKRIHHEAIASNQTTEINLWNTCDIIFWGQPPEKLFRLGDKLNDVYDRLDKVMESTSQLQCEVAVEGTSEAPLS